jgi:hypothetical protein
MTNFFMKNDWLQKEYCSDSTSSSHLRNIVRFGVNRHGFVICRKGASVGLKGWVLYINYSLPRVPSNAGLFWCIHNRSPPVEAKGLKGVDPRTSRFPQIAPLFRSDYKSTSPRDYPLWS